MRIKIIFIFLLIILPQATYAKITLPALVSDGMVLQRDQRIAIWGWADDQEKITVIFGNKTFITVCKNKQWKVWLPAMPAGGPYTMTIKGNNEITIKDILIGDVWVCSGQSNMEYVLKRSEVKYADDIARSGNNQIRQFAVKGNWSYTEANDVKSSGWEAANPQNVLKFTAVGYFFAKSLFEKYHVPIGLINSSYGGTPIEGWISESGLSGIPDLLTQFNNYKDPAKVSAALELNKTRTTAWYKKAAKLDLGRDSLTGRVKWSADTADRSFSKMRVPGFWQEQDLKNVNGIVWYSKQLIMDPGSSTQDALLELGNVFQEDTTYFNGVKIGSTGSQYLARRYIVPAKLIRPGVNLITIRILNKEGFGGFLKDKPYQITLGGKVIPLSGEWSYRVGAKLPPLVSADLKQFSREPVVLYNAMIAPLASYTIKGVIWYQGENNTADAKQYTVLFPDLIKDWREKWQQKDLPFVYVQLANYLPVLDHPSDSHWAELREAQLKTLSVPYTGMAVIHDTGEWNDVHPVNKKDVGQRLSLAAQHVAYHQSNVVFSGPVFLSGIVKQNKMIITFNTFGSQLAVKGGGQLKHFAIAGSDRKFVWANALIKDNQVIVWNDKILNPVAVRYAWSDNPQNANLYNADGLPASSFRTDNWDKTFFDSTDENR